MAKGISAALPLNINEVDGPYRLNKTIPEIAAQNLKMLILTIPGERIMMPQFGVGISRYVFENEGTHLRSELIGRIRSQVSTYLPYIFLDTVSVDFSEDTNNKARIGIIYSIPNNSQKQNLDIILNNM